MLSPYRVLDLTDDHGELAGFVLAALGADVIAVEAPGGSASRARGPFAGGEQDPDRSLTHWAYACGKRSVVLDFDLDADREAFLRLVGGADVVIESSRPGHLASLGLGYDDLARRNPSLIVASISPFGQDGPKAQWAATDITVWAAAGPMVLTGDHDRPPLRTSVPQAFVHASAEAAGAIIAALYERGRSGHGQHIDVSAVLASAQATQSAVLAVPNEAEVTTRYAGGLKVGPFTIQLVWPCADGHVSILFIFGTAIGPISARFMAWVHEAGYCDEATRDKDWVDYTTLLLSGAEPLEEYERVKSVIGAFCADHTKAELLAGAIERQLLIAPLVTIDDVVDSAQLAHRDYWVDIDGVRYPGPFAKLTETPLAVPSPPPRLGADTAAVLAEAPRRPACGPPATPAPSARPLEGVKILDLMWVMAGPAGPRVLGDLGATLVRVESSRRVETARTLAPFRRGEAGLETSCLFSNLNAGRLGLALDLTTPEGREVILDLVRWADVVTESFSPKALKNWGLDYDSLREVNPSIVMLSSCLFGQTGPMALYAGYGTMAAALSGFFSVTGWPDRPPAGPFAAYTDYISPRFANAALLAAIDHQRRTGEGQYIDYAQAEGALHALTPTILDWTVNGVIASPAGNDDLCHHPHGVYPCSGEDRWVAVACTDDTQRAALAGIVGGLDDDAIAAFTSERSPDEVAEILQNVGVPAHGVQNSAEFAADPQVVHRRHLRELPHPVMGSVTIEGPRFTMSRTSPDVTAPGPTIGQHTMEILTDLLGYDDERITELLISGALE